ncbi:MAG: fructose-1,6-bisphosphatase [Candidatus Peribacteraceae bacterium]|nr:fructose-1,6-bisphosphatase [Candidatus Peribacteraceae bacterium]
MALRPFLGDHLSQTGKAADELRDVILCIAQAGIQIQAALRKTDTGLSGTQNQFGEEQVKLDIVSDDIIQKHLKESGLVASFISEEQKDVIELSSTAPYSVVYDPLDGSSLVDVNFAVGSIFGIYRGAELIGKKPKQQVAALYVLYGPRTLLVYCTGNGVHEFILNDTGEFILLRKFLKVSDTAKNFAPGNLSSIMDDKPYHDVFHAWLKDKMTLRYSGCMVADIHHILSKGQGVFTYPAGSKYPDGKLRLVFECGPFAYLMEHAGGAASDGTGDIMDKKITDIDQRTPIIIGSKKEVERVCDLLS